jgi:anti-sigma B factor antagonist
MGNVDRPLRFGDVLGRSFMDGRHGWELGSTDGSLPAPLQIDQTNSGDGVVLRIAGEIDLASVGALEDALTAGLAMVASGELPIVVDLTAVNFLGSAGLAALLDAHRRAADQHTPLRIVVGTVNVLRPMEVTGMTRLLNLHANLGSALHRG